MQYTIYEDTFKNLIKKTTTITSLNISLSAALFLSNVNLISALCVAVTGKHTEITASFTETPASLDSRSRWHMTATAEVRLIKQGRVPWGKGHVNV